MAILLGGTLGSFIGMLGKWLGSSLAINQNPAHKSRESRAFPQSNNLTPAPAWRYNPTSTPPPP